MIAMVRTASLVGAAGLGLCLLGWVLRHPALLPSLLWSGVFWLDLSLGCLALRLIHGLTGGEWGRFAGPAYTAGIAALPLAALPFLLLLITDLETLFPWAAPAATLAPSVQAKAAWLNEDFFRGRTLAYLAVWLIVAWIMAAPERPGTGKSAAGLIFHIIAVSVFAFDWIMSLDPHWYSTVLGLLLAAAQVLAAGAVALLVACTAPPWRRVPAAREGRSDLANLVLAFGLVWIYLAFSQYLIIWSADLPHETSWYLRRAAGGWPAVAVLMVLLQFAAPFALLISRTVKRHPGALAGAAGLVLAGHFLNTVWLVTPAFRAEALDWSWTDAAAFAAVGGFWSALFLWRLERAVPRFEPARGIAPEAAG